MTFAPATGTSPYRGADGTCTSVGAESMVLLASDHPQSVVAGVVRMPPHGCTYESVAWSGADAYALEACGRAQSFLSGPATLVRFNAKLRPTHRWPIGECTDGNSLSASLKNGVLVSAYLFCNPPPAGARPSEPITALDRLQDGALRRLTTAPGGVLAFSYLAG